ncbi:MAG: hypothetical protein KKE20_02140, partial [Nanoarchaeota archaeon]|nr:hypothetical protein [Nanoarchaeota archaeon]
TEPMSMDSSSDSAKFVFLNKEGRQVSVPLHWNGQEIMLGDDYEPDSCSGRLLLQGETCSAGSSVADIERVKLFVVDSNSRIHIMEVTNIDSAGRIDITDLTYGYNFNDIPVTIGESDCDVMSTLELGGPVGDEISISVSSDGCMQATNIERSSRLTSLGAFVDISPQLMRIHEEAPFGLIMNLKPRFDSVNQEVYLDSPEWSIGNNGEQWNVGPVSSSRLNKTTYLYVSKWGTHVQYDSDNKDTAIIMYPDNQVLASVSIKQI